MTDMTSEAGGSGPSHRWVEIGVCLFMILFGGVIIAGSLKAGINWGAEGPKSGFFPFYLGVMIVGATAVNLSRVIMLDAHADRPFAEWSQLREVVKVVVPTAIYVAAIPTVGIYLSSFLLIGVFMKWLGRYNWAMTLAVPAGVTVLTYLMFERWFLVPLPKGPIEDFLGL